MKKEANTEDLSNHLKSGLALDAEVQKKEDWDSTTAIEEIQSAGLHLIYIGEGESGGIIWYEPELGFDIIDTGEEYWARQSLGGAQARWASSKESVKGAITEWLIKEGGTR